MGAWPASGLGSPVMAVKRRKQETHAQNGALAAEDARDLLPFQLSYEEGRRMFDERCRARLGISGDEFLRKWDAGEYGPDPDDHPGVMGLYMLLPFVRPEPAQG